MARTRIFCSEIALVLLHVRLQVYPRQSPSGSEELVLRGRLSRMRLLALLRHIPWLEARLSLRQPGSWHQGGFWEELELVMVELRVLFLLRVNMGQCNFVQGGPRIQGGYIVPTAKGTGQSDVKSAIGGHVPSNPGVAEFAIHTPRNGSSSSQGLI